MNSTVRLCLVMAAVMCLCGRGEPAGATLDQAIQAQAEVTSLANEADLLPPDVAGPMRRLLHRANAERVTATTFLTKDRYGASVAAFREAAALYRVALDGQRVLENLAAARARVDRARLIADASVPPEPLRAPRRLLQDAENLVERARFDHAIAKLAEAATAFEALVIVADATLDEAVAARSAMLSARAQVRDLPESGPRRPPRPHAGPGVVPAVTTTGRPGRSPRAGHDAEPRHLSFPDLVHRAQRAETAAAAALEDRAYGHARVLYGLARDRYLKAAEFQIRRDAAVALRRTARGAMLLADKAFATEARTAGFERGSQALADGNAALAKDDLHSAEGLYTQALAYFTAAQSEAVLTNDLARAQRAWSAAQAAARPDLLEKHAPGAAAAAQRLAAAAEAKAAAGDHAGAANGLRAASKALQTASAQALTATNADRADALVVAVEAAVERRDAFTAADRLKTLEALAPADPRLDGLKARAEALPGPRQTLRLDLGRGVMLELVLVRPGTFMMGSTDAADEGPVHEVTLSQPFYLGKYEVTQAQWQAVMGANPSQFRGDNRPVEQVSWLDCIEFISRLNRMGLGTFRLPTEAEWEYACRAGSTGAYSWDDSHDDLGEHGWHHANSDSQTHEVGQRRPNAWGLHDMHGNVWEWCYDRYGSYPSGEVVDPKGPGGDARPFGQSLWTDVTGRYIAVHHLRVSRGGSWCDDARSCHSAHRDENPTSTRSPALGLRLAYTGPSRDAERPTDTTPEEAAVPAAPEGR